jgi:hypothetical protein
MAAAGFVIASEIVSQSGNRDLTFALAFVAATCAAMALFLQWG